MYYREQITSKLISAKPKLVPKYNLKSIGIFGSFVRDDFSDESDIDILVEFDKPIGIEFIDLANELESILNMKVDLVSRNGIKPKYFNLIKKDIVYV
jgi:uncharacterized protein